MRFSNYITSSATDLVSNDQIVAFAAENSSIDTVWFVYVIDIKCVDHTSNDIDDYGHKSLSHNPAGIYLLTVNNRNTKNKV